MKDLPLDEGWVGLTRGRGEAGGVGGVGDKSVRPEDVMDPNIVY